MGLAVCPSELPNQGTTREQHRMALRLVDAAVNGAKSHPGTLTD